MIDSIHLKLKNKMLRTKPTEAKSRKKVKKNNNKKNEEKG